MSKSERTLKQESIIKKWDRQGGRAGTVQAATGFGKTRIALMILDELGLTAEIIVPTLYLQGQWRERLQDWNLSDAADVMVINSAVKENNDVELLILDEIHRYGSKVFGKIFQKRNYDYLLGLTATLPKSGEKYSYIRDYAPVIAEIPLKECLRNEWVSPFVVYNLPIELSFSERKQYSDLNDKYNYHFSRFGHDFNLAMKCLKDDDFARQYARQRQWKYNKVKKHAAQWIRNTNKRKKMLYNLTSKLKVGKKLIKKFPDKKIISFSQTQQFAERLCEYAKGHAVPYHSDMTKGEKEDAMELFRKGDRHVLSTAKSMDQGADLPDLSMALVLAATSKPLQSIQRMGRVLRKQEGKRAIIVEVYAKDTQDEKWLKKRQRKTPRKAIHYVNEPDDIIMEPTQS